MTQVRRDWVTFTVLAIATSSFALLQSLIIPVLPTIQAELETSQSTVTWVLTAYLLSASVCTPLVGRAGDVVGKTRMLVVVLTMLSMGSLLAALAPSIGWLIGARVLQGAGGGVLPLAFGILRDEFHERMSTAVSVIASLTAMGFGLGIVVAGPLVTAFGYHGLFWLPMGVTSVAALGAILFVPESPVHAPVRLPILPAAFLAAWLVALLLGLSQGGQRGWGSPVALGLVAAGLVLAAAWVLVEHRAPVPIIDMDMMLRRGVWTANVVAWAAGFTMFAFFGFLPQLLQTPPQAGYGFGATVSESGRLLVPSALASFAIGFGSSALVSRFSSRTVIAAGMLVTGAALASVALFHEFTWQLYAATTVQGVGSGLVFAALAGVVVMSVPAEQTGVVSGMNANIRTIGGAIGAAVMAGILASRLGPDGYPAERSYEVGFLVLGLVSALASVVAWWIPDLGGERKVASLADGGDGSPD